MAWSSNKFCDFGMSLNAQGQGQQNSARNRVPGPMFNPNSGNKSSNSISKLESLKAGTAAVRGCLSNAVVMLSIERCHEKTSLLGF